MGNTVSQAVLQDYTSLLRKFSGTSRIDSEDPYWRQLFAFPASLSQVDPKLVAQTIIDCCTSLATPLLQQLVQTLVHTLAQTPISGRRCLLHLEATNLLLVLSSTQLYTTAAASPAGTHPFIDSIMQQTQLAPQLVQQSLQHFITRPPLPPGTQLWSPSQDAGNGVLHLVRTAADSNSPLADCSLLLLLVLINHSPRAAQPQHSSAQHGSAPHESQAAPQNPYLAALQSVQDAADAGADAESGLGQAVSGVAAVSYTQLYNAVGANLHQEAAVLLLYALMHKCYRFQQYVLVRSDADVLLMPILQRLYHTSYKTPSQLYMLLIVILILSQDHGYSQSIQDVTLSSVPWYKERTLQKTSLGSLLVVLLLRTAHYNMSKLKDVYMHQNTLAALANVAPHMSGISSHAAQRLVSLFDMLAKRYQRIGRRAKNSGTPTAETPSAATPFLGATPLASPGQLAAEQTVYADFMRTVLEIINSIITTGLKRNPEMVYALLHRQEVFEPFRMHVRFADILDNIQVVVDTFNQKIDSAQHRQGWEGSVTDIMGVIQDRHAESLSAWQPIKLSPPEDLRFTYEEEEFPEDFFVPYVWSIVVSNTSIPWNLHAVALFQPVALKAEDRSVSGRSLSQTNEGVPMLETVSKV